MEANFRIGQELRLQHLHDDGTTSPMVLVHPDAANHDQERSWLRGLIFRCTTCSDAVLVTNDQDPPAVEEEGLIGG
jgi:hypothetical protein